MYLYSLQIKGIQTKKNQGQPATNNFHSLQFLMWMKGNIHSWDEPCIWRVHKGAPRETCGSSSQSIQSTNSTKHTFKSPQLWPNFNTMHGEHLGRAVVSGAISQSISTGLNGSPTTQLTHICTVKPWRHRKYLLLKYCQGSLHPGNVTTPKLN
jgi:hypothetical protein